ncbi:MAG TPA: radical SAM protein [Armatimonadetes bacterium]|jgi:DNA repair photolyase|nr:radical SAM protein [Armatimonadota bacterium]
MITRETRASRILTKSKLPASDYCLNPYVGCAHACVYCYARFMCRFTGHTEKWGEFVDVRVNAPELLRNELRRPHSGTVLLGSVTDCYQPLERRYQLTRQMLACLAGSGLSVSVLTKSDLVVRDIDLLAAIEAADVGLTLTSLDDEVGSRFEHRAPRISRRVEALAALKRAGLTTYAFVGPILPGLTDPLAIIRRVAGSVDYLMFEALNVRCGSRAQVAEVVRRHYPELSEQFSELSRSPDYWAAVEREVRAACREMGVRMAGFFQHGARPAAATGRQGDDRVESNEDGSEMGR